MAIKRSVHISASLEWPERIKAQNDACNGPTTKIMRAGGVKLKAMKSGYGYLTAKVFVDHDGWLIGKAACGDDAVICSSASEIDELAKFLAEIAGYTLTKAKAKAK